MCDYVKYFDADLLFWGGGGGLKIHVLLHTHAISCVIVRTMSSSHEDRSAEM